MELIQNREKRTGLIAAGVFHLLLLLLFLILGLSHMEPNIEEGVWIDLGDSMTGFGEVASENPEPAAAAAAVTPVEQTEPNDPQPTSEPVEEVVEDPVMTQEEMAALEMAEAKKQEQLKQQEEQEQRERQAAEVAAKEAAELAEKQAKADATKKAFGEAFAGAEKGGGGSQGDKQGAGDYGDPNGREGGPGQGFSDRGNIYSLAGRKPLGLGKPNPNPTHEGIVVVSIMVNQNGKVISAMPGAKGSTITDPQYLAHCKKAALESKFTAHPNGTVHQRGTITFEFTLN